MSERRLAAVLTKRFSRLTWTALAGYALLVVVAFGTVDIYVVSREPYAVTLLGRVIAAALLLPVAALGASRGVRTAVADALRPLERVTTEMRAIGPADLGKRIDSPTGQAEVTQLAQTINHMLGRVDRAHRALEAFAADASHELRLPLMQLRAQVQWASVQGRSQAAIRESLAAMESEIERTTKMVDDLLLVARGESQQMGMTRAPFDLTAVVDDVKEITEAMAAGRGLEVRSTEWAPAPVAALGDANRTRHILLNLASNAVRYTARGRVSFFVREDGARVGVSVQDTGTGIAPEHLPHVFDRFFRVEQSPNRALGGTGLGLAIARLLAELQGGDIAVESVLGHGSTFTLWLPRAVSAVQPAPPARAQVHVTRRE